MRQLICHTNGFLITGLAALLLGGCEAASPGVISNDSIRSFSIPDERSVSERILSKFINVNNGLEVRRWMVQSDSQKIGQTLQGLSQGAAADDATLEMLRRNGFRLIRVPLGDLDLMEKELLLYQSISEWHGEVSQWRDIIDTPIDSSNPVVAIDGHVSRFEPGRMQMLMRSWAVQMEGQPYLHLDLVPIYATKTSRSMNLLPGDRRRDGRRFDELSMVLQLEPDWAYILTAERPNVRWPGDIDSDVSRSTPNIPARPTRGRGPAAGPAASSGPVQAGPTTLGVMMLVQRTPIPLRTLLVFVPKIAMELYPVPRYFNEVDSESSR